MTLCDIFHVVLRYGARQDTGDKGTVMTADPAAILPRIDERTCTGCGICVTACPTRALSQVDNKARLTHPDLCTYCTICEGICPVDAIELPFLIVFSEPHLPVGPILH